MDARIFLDEFRPFRRGEIALARRVAAEPRFLPERELALLRHALRLAQLSSLGGAPDELVDRIGSLRERGAFRARERPRFGRRGALRLDLRSALGELFGQGGRQLSLGELPLPTDVLTTGLGPGALSEPSESYARVIDHELHSAV